MIPFLLACHHRPPPAAPAAAEAQAAAHWFDVEAGKPMCVSRFPDAPPLPAADARRFDDALAMLARGELAQAVTALEALPQDHPAVQGATAVMGLLVGQPDAPATLLRLADEHPGDACALVDGALAAAATGDLAGAGDRVLKGRLVAPRDARVALLSWYLDLEPATAVIPVLEEGLAASPGDAGYSLALGVERLRAGEDGFALLEDALAGGVAEAGGLLLVSYRDAGRRGDYLRLASKMGLMFDEGKVAAVEDTEAAYDELIGLKPGEHLQATIHTSMGDLVCRLLPDAAPLTIVTFVGLAKGTIPWIDPRDGEKKTVPLYDGTVFHRVIPEFMVQGGDPRGDGSGGPGWRLPDEVVADVRFDAPGVLAMANSGPNTTGSQFFVTEAPVAHLDGRHTIIGRCDDAAVEVVKKIARVERDAEDHPKVPVVIEHIDIESVSDIDPAGAETDTLP